ncbi:hypothetical protein PNEG_03373 [Pneumocystis murina B123]|uniref:RRM domain-containing protein n=1 Tax=Pneumocystis murina (strain B123) TaxID=1069680 RepID=M7NI15_PNEMU|nr:hypothetical protein PNEG_03373 [Pneumocystis murina B123]EMR08203.1 hypothetical protein PNEG_03373 [Pneumocystis murina B123]
MKPDTSPLLEPGSGTASSNSSPPSPKLLDTFLADAPNTPITPFTNRDSGNNTDNTSPLDFYSQDDKDVCVITPEEASSPFIFAQKDQELSNNEKCVPKVSTVYFEKANSEYSDGEASFSIPDISSLSCKDLNEEGIKKGVQYEGGVLVKPEENKTSCLLSKETMFSHETIYPAKKVGESSENRGRPAACLFVASLSSSRTDEELCASVTNHFRKWGNLLNVKVLKDWMQRPYSFVQFENFEDAKRALREAHNTVIDGRHIRVEKARVNRTLYISRIGQSLEEQDVKNLLEPYGEIEDIVIPSSSNQMLRNDMGKCCFARFAFRDDAIQAFSNLRRNGNWIVEWAQNLDQNTSQIPMIPIDKTSVFVGQLNPSLVTRESLLNRFKKYGEIVDCSLVNKPNSNRTAFAFLQFESATSASAAVENENNSNFLDRVIRVQFRELYDKTDLSTYDSRSLLPSINPQSQFACKFPLSVPFIPRLRSRSNDSLSLTNRGSIYGQDNSGVHGYYPEVTNQAFSMRSHEAFMAAYRAALAATTSLNQPSAINTQNGYSGNIQVPYPGTPVGLTNYINSNSSTSGYANQHTMMNIHQNSNIIPSPFYYFAGGMSVPPQNITSNSLNQDSLSPQQERVKGNNVSPPFLSHWGAFVPTFIHGPGTSMQASVSLPGHSFSHQDSMNRFYHFPEGISNGSMHPAWDPSFGYYRLDNQCSPEMLAFPVQVPTVQDNLSSSFPVYGEVSGHNTDQNVHPPYSHNQATVNGGITT